MSMSTDPRKEKGSHAYSLISIMPTAGFGSSNISESKNITSSGSLEKIRIKKELLFLLVSKTSKNYW
jgi:hypothetical protein